MNEDDFSRLPPSAQAYIRELETRNRQLGEQITQLEEQFRLAQSRRFAPSSPLLQADCEGPYPHLLRRLLRHTNIACPHLIDGRWLELAREQIRRHQRLATALLVAMRALAGHHSCARCISVRAR